MDNGLLDSLISQALQVALLAMSVFVIARSVGKNRPHFAHMLWALVLLKCITPPIWSSPTGVFSWLPPIATMKDISIANDEKNEIGQRREHSATSGLAPIPVWIETLETDDSDVQVSVQSSEGLSSTGMGLLSSPRRFSWQAIVLGVWTFGTVVGLAVCVARFCNFTRRLRCMTVIHDPRVEEAVRDIALRLRIRRRVRVQIINGPIGPAVMGLLRPTILLPSMIVENRSTAQLQPLIAHELIHVRRGDLWWAMLQSIATSLWWFHPLVWIASRMLTWEAERSCDEETIACLRCKPAAYARNLLDVLEQKNRLHVAPALPGVRPIDVTANRLERIMRLGQGSCQKTPWWVKTVMLMSALAFLPGASLVTAQESETPSTPSHPPRPIARPASEIPLLPRALPNPTESWGIDRIDVQEVLDPLIQSGLSQRAAAEELLRRLPAAPADPLDRDAQLSTEGGPIKLGGRNPYRQILEGTLYVFGSSQFRQTIAEQFAHFRQYGFDSVRITATLIEVPKAQWEHMGIPWNAFDGSRPETVSGKSVASDVATIDVDSVDELVRSIVGARVLSGPTVVTPNGRQASLKVGQVKSLTTGFRTTRNEMGQRKYKPVRSDIHSGIELKLRPEFVSSDQLRLDFDLNQSKILSIESVPIRTAESKNPIQIEIPEMFENAIAWTGQFSQGETLAVGGPPSPEGDRSHRMLVLISWKKIACANTQAKPASDDRSSRDVPSDKN